MRARRPAVRGLKQLSVAEEKDGVRGRNRAPSAAGEGLDNPKQKKKTGNTPEVGHALRSAYQQTINEDIPPEMLDLLGKLG